MERDTAEQFGEYLIVRERSSGTDRCFTAIRRGFTKLGLFAKYIAVRGNAAEVYSVKEECLYTSPGRVQRSLLRGDRERGSKSSRFPVPCAKNSRELSCASRESADLFRIGSTTSVAHGVAPLSARP